jgi:hypothetical protein
MVPGEFGLRITTCHPEHAMTTRTIYGVSAFALAYLLSTGCGSGDGGGGPTPGLTLTVNNAGPTTLGTETSIEADLEATGGFAGPVTLTLTGAPPTWNVAVPGAPIDLATNGTAFVTIVVTIPPNGATAPTGQTLTVHATAASISSTGSTSLVVANEFIVPIALGTGAGAHWGALAGTTIHLNVGVTLSIRNDDTIPHRVHTNGGIVGFPHQQSDLLQGDSFVNVLGAGSDYFSCHDHGDDAGIVNLVMD